MSNLMETLASKIPDFKEIVDIFNGMVAQHKEDTANIEDTRKTYVNEHLYLSFEYHLSQVFCYIARRPLQISKKA